MYEYIEIYGLRILPNPDCARFSVGFKPIGGKDQIVLLESETGQSARYEVASMLDMPENSVPETEWS